MGKTKHEIPLVQVKGDHLQIKAHHQHALVYLAPHIAAIPSALTNTANFTQAHFHSNSNMMQCSLQTDESFSTHM